jgi:hypothetical protein
MNLLGQQRTACRSGGIWSLLSIDHPDESGIWLIKDAGDGGLDYTPVRGIRTSDVANLRNRASYPVSMLDPTRLLVVRR